MLLISLFAYSYVAKLSTLGATSFQSRKQATGNEPTIYSATKWELNEASVELWIADHFVNNRSGVHFSKEKQSMRIWMLFFSCLLSEGNKFSHTVNSGPYLLLFVRED